MGRGNFSFNLIVFLKLSTVYLPDLGFGQINHIISQVLSIHLHLYWMKIVKNAPKMLKFFKLFLRGRMPSDLPSGMELSAPYMYMLEDDHRQTPDYFATFSSFLLLLSSFSSIQFVAPSSSFVLFLLQYVWPLSLFVLLSLSPLLLLHTS